MQPLRIYKCADGTTRQFREGNQPSTAVPVAAAAKQTPEARAAKAPAKRAARKRTAEGKAD